MAYNFRDNLPEVERSHEQKETEEHFQPTGTSESHYSPPADGPFKCGNCVHYKRVNGTHGTCDHPEVIEDAQQGELPTAKENGQPAAMVALEGCCEFYRKGEHE